MTTPAVRLMTDTTRGEQLLDKSLPPSLSLIGGGMLQIGRGQSGSVAVQAHATDGSLPGWLEVAGEQELMDAAYHRRTVNFDLCGATFRAPVMGQRKDTGAVLVKAKPMYAAIARLLE
jgi:hypothetical protein